MSIDFRVLTRRRFLERLTALPAAVRLASAAGFQSASLHHVSIQVTDLMRSSEFYHRVFGLAVENRPDGTVRLVLGRGSIILRRGNPPGIVDHFALGIDGFNKEAAIQDLKARGAEPFDNPAAGLSVKDPDGFPVQLTDNANYIHSGAASAFAGASLDHVSVHARDVNISSAYYQKVFGTPIMKPPASNSGAPQTLYLSLRNSYVAVRVGNPPGQVDHFAIGIEHFEQESVIRDLKARGATPVEEREKGLHVKDPDGYPVQVIDNNWAANLKNA